MNKKDIATLFLELVASGNVREAYDKYVHQDFKHHNAYFKGDRESLLVATHSRLLRADSNAPEIAAVHIFRFQDGKIIEEWEVSQEALKDSPNKNGIF